MLRRIHHALLRLVTEHPLMLPALFFAYLAAFLLFVFAVVYGGAAIRSLAGREVPFVSRGLIVGLILTGLALIFFHYWSIVISASMTSLNLRSALPPVSKAVQLLVSLIVVFGVVYYYMQLVSGDTALRGMHPIFSSGSGVRPEAGLDLFFITPPIETVVDCFYFSVVTAATVGFGDIHPVAWWAKLTVTLEVAVSFIIIVLAIGSSAKD